MFPAFQEAWTASPPPDPRSRRRNFTADFHRRETGGDAGGVLRGALPHDAVRGPAPPVPVAAGLPRPGLPFGGQRASRRVGPNRPPSHTRGSGSKSHSALLAAVSGPVGSERLFFPPTANCHLNGAKGPDGDSEFKAMPKEKPKVEKTERS